MVEIKRPCLSVQGKTEERTTTLVPGEEPIKILVNGQEFVTLLATPADIKGLAVGFLFTEGIIKAMAEVLSLELSESQVRVKLKQRNDSLEIKPAMISSGCGRGLSFQPIEVKVRIADEGKFLPLEISGLMREFLASSRTKGVHSAGLADIKQGILVFKEDIGRHNAIDKVLGEALMKGIPFQDKLLLTTGRISSEMVIKAARARIPVLAARSYPTSLAIELSEQVGITMIGQIKTDSMNVYTHQSRVIGERDSLVERIRALKKEKEAIILAHNYQPEEIQDIADFVGDSLDLSRHAAKTQAKIIVFCGVHFMAETAKILSPNKMVLLPDIKAGCPMADMVPVEELKRLKAEHPQAVVIAYVNTHAQVKAESDYCCTSANGVKVVSSLPKEQEIIFTPDKYLGDYINRQTMREMILMPGYCPTHQFITVAGIEKLKQECSQAKVLVHPECSPDVVAIADAALGTNGICKYASQSEAKEFIIGTETGIIHRLKKENPDKQFYPASEQAVCPNMKLITLEKVLWALEDQEYRIELPEGIAQTAKRAIERMLSIT